jgi:hypothetical protein
MRTGTVVGIVALLAGCATAQPTAPGMQTFAGEVWTWDEPSSVVTLREDGGRLVRVKVDPQTLGTLRLHQYTSVSGTPAPPVEISHTTLAAGPVTPVPRGQPEILEVAGTVTMVDAKGRLALVSDRGPLHLWVAENAERRFPKGAPVAVRISVQPVDLVPAGAPTPPTPAPVGTGASTPSEPGDHAVVTGRIIGINPGGVLVVESPTGPIQVLSADASRYRVGDAVQVRTSVRTKA